MEATAIADALYSRIVIIPGGRDIEERPIILIDAELTSRAANEQLDKVLKYFSSIFSTDTRRLGLCIIINSQRTTWRVTRLILQQVTEIFRTELTTIIILRPEAFWDKQKVENCARLKHYHGVIYIPITRLHKYVSPAHLPEELEGTWVYNHRLWIENRIKVEKFVKLSENAVINLESIRHRLNTAKECLECKITDDVCFVSAETYELTRRSTLKTVNAGYSLIEQLEKQHTDQQQHLITIPQDILDTKDRINRLLQIISGKMTLVDESWIDVHRRKEDIKEVMMIEDGVCQVTNWILGPGEMLLNAQQNIGYDVVSAEDLRRSHDRVLLTCRKPYGHYAEILHKLDVLARNGMQFPRDLKSQKDFMDFVCRSFATRVERRRNVLITSARFFRLVSEYFQITSNVYENLIMCIDVETLESAEDTLEELQNSLTNIDALEKELVREGEKLSDLLSIPVKDALGRELAVNYQDDIVNVREILEMTIARRQLFKDSVELQKLTLQQVLHINNYEKNAKQAIEWLQDLYQVLLKSHSHIGCSVQEIQVQKEKHQCFQETAKGTFEFGCQLLQAALVLRQSCRLSEHANIELTRCVWNSWKKLYDVSQEQLTRLRVSAVFHRNVDQYSQQLKELTENFIVSVVEEETPKKRTQLNNTLLVRENILTEVGRMMRLGRMLKTRLREPLCPNDDTVEVNDNNDIAITAISEKLSEVTILAERLDTTLCGFKFAMESDNIKKLLESTDTDCHQEISSKSNGGCTKSSSDGSKSDEDFVTASECTGTPPSRTSDSYHTASEGDPASPWWDIDPSLSSESEETSRVKAPGPIRQTPEESSSIMSYHTSQLPMRSMKPSPVESSSSSADPIDGIVEKENRQNSKLNQSLLQNIYASKDTFERHIPTRCADTKQRIITNEELLQNLKQSANSTLRQKRTLESLVQEQIDRPNKVSDPFCYQKRFMKQAITGIF